MEVQLTPDQQALVRQVIDSGRMKHEAEVIQEAFSLWESRERQRIEILAAFDAAESDLQSGFYTDHTDATLPELAASLKQEARAARDTHSMR